MFDIKSFQCYIKETSLRTLSYSIKEINSFLIVLSARATLIGGFWFLLSSFVFILNTGDGVVVVSGI